MSAYFMGLDNGGTAVKCVIFDDRGCEIAEASVKTPVLSPRVHFEERDMGELWEANVTVISACIQKSGVDPSEILGIGCTIIEPTRPSRISLTSSGLSGTPLSSTLQPA